MRDKLDKDYPNTAYRWGIVVGQPNLDWSDSFKPNMSVIGKWVQAIKDQEYRTLDSKKIVVFNSEKKAIDAAAKISGKSWNYEAKLITKKS